MSAVYSSDSKGSSFEWQKCLRDSGKWPTGIQLTVVHLCFVFVWLVFCCCGFVLFLMSPADILWQLRQLKQHCGWPDVSGSSYNFGKRKPRDWGDGSEVELAEPSTWGVAVTATCNSSLGGPQGKLTLETRHRQVPVGLTDRPRLKVVMWEDWGWHSLKHVHMY